MSDAVEPRDRLAHIGDLHFWRVVLNPFRLMNKRFLGNLTVVFRRRFEFVMERAEPFADAVAATGVPNVLLTGDFASTALDEDFGMAVQFVRGLKSRGLNVFLMPGNHDVYTFESRRAQRFERYLAEFLPEGGYPVRYALPGGTPLLLVPTALPRHLSARGAVAPETVERVRNMLRDCGPRAIVAAHYPVLHHTHGYHSNVFRRLANAEAFRRMLGESGKEILYLCGHVHRYSLEHDARYTNLIHASAGAFFRSNQTEASQGEFTEVAVYADRFGLTRHLYKEGWAILKGL